MMSRSFVNGVVTQYQTFPELKDGQPGIDERIALACLWDNRVYNALGVHIVKVEFYIENTDYRFVSLTELMAFLKAMNVFYITDLRDYFFKQHNQTLWIESFKIKLVRTGRMC